MPSFDDATTHQQPRIELPEPSAGAFGVVVTEGADRGQRFVVDDSHASRVLIGQSPACEIRLRDRSVSRRHAALDIRHAELVLSDLGSTNGTFVDGVRVVEAYLRVGQTVRIGATALRIERAETVAHTIQRDGFGGLVGASAAMRRLYPLCERLAASNVPVIIEGETGTGKEVLAESLHAEGPRAAGPFVVFDCTAVPSSLMESELFGHEKGAFTGAAVRRVGMFEQAHGGTLLIDEIGDLDVALQPKLLRAIERSEVRPIGGNESRRVDVRIVAATRRDLDREIAAGRFRDDLFHRLAVARIELPPLRDRRGDVRLLARHFCRLLGFAPDALAEDVIARWEDEPWTGNIRELRNAVAGRLALGDLSPARRPSAFPPSVEGDDVIAKVVQQQLAFSDARKQVLEKFERSYIEGMLARFGGDTARAAEASGVGRRYLQMLLARSRK